MSFKLAFLFVVCFLALAGAIPLEKPEGVEDTKEAPVAAQPETEAPEEASDPEEKEEEESPGEDQETEPEQDPEQEQEENDEEDKQDEEEPEADDTEDEPENEVEAKEDEENDPTPGRRHYGYHPKCKYIWKKVHKCYYKLKCTGSYYSKRGRCCHKRRYCRYVRIKVRICQTCRRKCRHICKYKRRRVCQPFLKCVWRRRRVRRGKHGYYHYHYVKYRYCKHVTKCRYIRYKFCQIKCYGYVCRYKW